MDVGQTLLEAQQLLVAHLCSLSRHDRPWPTINPGQSMGDPCRGMTDPRRGMADPDRGMTDPDRGVTHTGSRTNLAEALHAGRGMQTLVEACTERHDGPCSRRDRPERVSRHPGRGMKDPDRGRTDPGRDMTDPGRGMTDMRTANPRTAAGRGMTKPVQGTADPGRGWPRHGDPAHDVTDAVRGLITTGRCRSRGV